MKIAVFNCPTGITGEGILRAFFDAGLPPSYLRKELKKARTARGLRGLMGQMARRLRRAGFSGPGLVNLLMHVAGAGAALRYFGVEKCFVRRLAIGRRGNPKTLKLLTGFVLERAPVNREIVSADGAAILAAFCETDDAIPAMKLEAVGDGPGELRVTIGEALAPYRRERILLLETNIDDMSPQGFELLYERLFKGGALDVWVQSILMKKMRPAFKLSVLLNHPDREKISEVLFKETPTLGVRFLELDRSSLPRKRIRVKTRFGPVRVKVGQLDSHYFSRNPEYEDLRRIARRKNIAFQRVWTEVKKELA